MRNVFHTLAAAAAFSMTACVAMAAEQDFSEANSGVYELDKGHASLIWRVSHSGLSMYTARFTDFDATIQFDAKNPTKSTVTATINPMSVQTDHPSTGDDDSWNNKLATNANLFNAEEFPQITFKSTKVEKTDEFTGKITGDLTFLGVTKPVTLDATFNGTGNSSFYGTRDQIGFSATTTLTRSDFGLDTYLPNIGDEVEIILEVEFIEPESE